ncbi:glutathione S- transferase, nitrogen catabolite repression regulator [Ophidiomyces ophidiicola]|uniref:Glutathione S- transferase, nitrogen catabolite repression regulator n=1 Tax=Ophidiomyces ophidiicola TaxID=1387563 RepID=A0ACB8UQM9_9EURO|nr:glutathione S- transferase, nitrogen catabolite repression regulator [Ophidiomyces ophidiicola]KAI1953254.1 glutathione S- transferase, nitrogen catabolite repression regulator [Ophidiomyces ophidiicola]KAI2000430.1 glutathione S- transferase, nitrogen catabolite repression regulator [Ophidiomyces ophidiicola]KAI2033475.1 glutathione S- transferase, nitrogen catabolite repression regulator [Ophidiomyces ophidiicola]KAI2039289.1 glutathione S- transferase, nitrogen catabolite repression regul
MSLKPLKLYGSLHPPNPPKVAFILCELSLPYEVVNIPREEIKGPFLTSFNPNGRVPVLVDPNNGDFTIWESGAIMNYLVSQYDTEHKISFPYGTKEYHLTQQYLHFQMSGQGPYYGQWSWFNFYHSEKIPGVIERYSNEAKRVSQILEKCLEGKEFLMGDKCTFADLAFYPWQWFIMSEGVALEEDAPNVHRWMQRMSNRPSVIKVFKDREAYAPAKA